MGRGGLAFCTGLCICLLFLCTKLSGCRCGFCLLTGTLFPDGLQPGFLITGNRQLYLHISIENVLDGLGKAGGNILPGHIFQGKVIGKGQGNAIPLAAPVDEINPRHGGSVITLEEVDEDLLIGANIGEKIFFQRRTYHTNRHRIVRENALQNGLHFHEGFFLYQHLTLKGNVYLVELADKNNGRRCQLILQVGKLLGDFS